MQLCMPRFLLCKSYSTAKIRLSIIDMATHKISLHFEISNKCQTTKARTGKITLVHHNVDTPVFMPVATKVCIYSILALFKNKSIE